MNRRALLATLGASIAGCAGCVSAVNGGPPTSDGSDSIFEASEVQRRVSLGEVDDAPVSKVSLDAELLNGTVTGEGPARVRVSLTNEGKSKRLTDNEGECALFNRRGGASDPAGVSLHQPEFPGYTGECRHYSRRGNRWRLDRPSSEDCRVLSYGCESVAYEAGETRATTYQLWDDHTVEGYMPPDTYRFKAQVAVDEESFDWGFSVVVESPE